jgi:hypothetical protein
MAMSKANLLKAVGAVAGVLLLLVVLVLGLGIDTRGEDAGPEIDTPSMQNVPPGHAAPMNLDVEPDEAR